MSADNTARIAILLDNTQANPAARATSKEIDGIGASAKVAGVSAVQGLGQVEAATQSLATGTASLGVRQIELQNDLKRVKAEIAGYAANLQELNALTPRTAAAQAALNLEIKQETIVLEELIAIQSGYKSELAQVNAALAGNTVATEVNSAAQKELAVSSGLSTRQIVQVGAAISRLEGAAIPGVRSIGVLAGSFSTAILPQLALIIGISLLIGWLVKLGRAKEEVLKIDDEALAKDALLATMARTVAEAYEREQIVLKDMRGLLIGYKEGVEALATAKLTEATATHSAVEFNQQWAHSAELTKSTGDAMAGSLFEVGKSVESVMHAEGEATVKRQEAQSVLDKNIAALIRFAAETGKSKGEVLAMAQAIPELSSVLGRLEDDLNNGALAVAKFNLQLNKLSVPQFDISKTVGGIQAQAKAVKEGLGDIAIGTQAAAQLGIRNFDDQVRALSPTLKGLAADLKQNKTALGEGNEEVARAIQRYDQLEVKHKSGAGAARAHALAENSLTRELKDAQAALIGDSFAARDQKITNDVAAEREALRLKKELNTVAIGQLVELEKAKHQKVAQDRRLAEQRLMDELQVMQIAGMAGELDRERATLALRLKQRVEEIHKEFGFTVEATELVNAFRRAEEEALARWTLDRHQKLSDELGKIGLEALKRDGVAYEKQIAANMKFEEDAFKKHEAEMDNLKKHLGGIQARGRGAVAVPDVNVLARDIDLLKKLEISAADVDKEFGSASRSTLQWQTRLEILAKSAGIAGAANVSLIGNLKQLVDWQNIFTQAINLTIQAISGAIAGTDNMGRALLVGFLRIVAEIAATLGTLFLLAAAGFIALPGFQWTAGQLFAAGAALIAFAGVVGGVAQLIENKGKQNSAGTSAASGTSAGTPATQRQGVGPNVVPFPTSPTIVSVKLDARGTKAMLDGHEVVVMADFHGTGSNTPALRKRISKWSKAPYAS